MFILLCCFSCSKSTDNPANNNTTVKHNYGTYTFVNPTTNKLNVTVYKSLNAYATDSNNVTKFSITPNGTYTATGVIDSGVKYYFDCYSDSYSYHNWSDSLFFIYSFVFYKKTDSLHPVLLNNIYRTMLLKNTSLSTKWVAVNALDATLTNSVWSQLPFYQKYYQITVNKDFSVNYTIQLADSGLHSPTGNTLYTFTDSLSVTNGNYPVFSLFPASIIPGHAGNIDTLISSNMLGGASNTLIYRLVFARQ
jgi:hypothetical protein